MIERSHLKRREIHGVTDDSIISRKSTRRVYNHSEYDVFSIRSSKSISQGDFTVLRMVIGTRPFQLRNNSTVPFGVEERNGVGKGIPLTIPSL